MERKLSFFLTHVSRSLDQYAGILMAVTNQAKCAKLVDQSFFDNMEGVIKMLRSLREFADHEHRQLVDYLEVEKREIRKQIREELEQEQDKKTSSEKSNFANISVKKEVVEAQGDRETGSEKNGTQENTETDATPPKLTNVVLAEIPLPPKKNEDKRIGNRKNSETDATAPKRPNTVLAEIPLPPELKKNEDKSTESQQNKVRAKSPLKLRVNPKREYPFYWQSSPLRGNSGEGSSGNQKNEETAVAATPVPAKEAIPDSQKSKNKEGESDGNQKKEERCTRPPLKQRKGVKKEPRHYWQSSPLRSTNDEERDEGQRTEETDATTVGRPESDKIDADSNTMCPSPATPNQFDRSHDEQEAIDNFDYSSIQARYMSDDEIETDSESNGHSEEQKDLWNELESEVDQHKKQVEAEKKKRRMERREIQVSKIVGMVNVKKEIKEEPEW